MPQSCMAIYAADTDMMPENTRCPTDHCSKRSKRGAHVYCPLQVAYYQAGGECIERLWEIEARVAISCIAVTRQNSHGLNGANG